MSSVKSMFGDIIDEYWSIFKDNLTLGASAQITKKAAKATITTEIGLLTGYLSNKVLAQYDLLIPPTPENSQSKSKIDRFSGSESRPLKKHRDNLSPCIYFVEPNIQSRKSQLGIDGTTFRLWITLHELAHKYQFEQNPWIKKYYFDLLEETKSIIKSPKNEKGAKDKLTFLLAPDNYKIISKVQAFMSVIEGYADYMMFTLAKKLPHYEQTAPFFERKKTGGTLKEIFEKLIGFDLKLKQYKAGYKFIAAVANGYGMGFLQDNLCSGEALPTLNEIENPPLWVHRIKGQQ